MAKLSDMKLREAKAYLSFVAGADTERAIDARSYHITRHYDADDFTDLVATLERTGSTASIAFLGRDAEERAGTMSAVYDAGHEIVLHGHRHVKFGELDYDTAHSDLSQGMNAIEDAAGHAPTGFFAPFKAVSQGTLEATADLGLEWVLGQPTNGEAPDDVTLVDSVYPHDTRLLEGGTPPEETFERQREATESGATFLFHPNMLDYYGATEEWEGWLDEVGTTSVSAQLETGEGVSIVLDCLRPLKLA